MADVEEAKAQPGAALESAAEFLLGQRRANRSSWKARSVTLAPRLYRGSHMIFSPARQIAVNRRQNA